MVVIVLWKVAALSGEDAGNVLKPSSIECTVKTWLQMIAVIPHADLGAWCSLTEYSYKPF